MAGGEQLAFPSWLSISASREKKPGGSPQVSKIQIRGNGVPTRPSNEYWQTISPLGR
jgi:hypothetical protein